MIPCLSVHHHDYVGIINNIPCRISKVFHNIDSNKTNVRDFWFLTDYKNQMSEWALTLDKENHPSNQQTV